MTYSALADDGPPDGMAELRSDPIFLSQFLRLSLPVIDAVEPPKQNGAAGQQAAAAMAKGSAYMPPSVGTPEPLKTMPSLEPWLDETSKLGFKENIETMLSNMDEVENFQHILPPPAFRKGDLPQATMLPTVHLWCIIQAWQPFNRVLNLEEELSLGGHTKEGRLRGPLQLSDHTLAHASLPRAIPRQTIFRPAEGDQLRGCIIVKEPWLVSIPKLFDDKGAPLPLESGEAKDDATTSALKETLAYMKSTKTTHAILTTYQHFVFLRALQASADGELGAVQISPPISASDKTTTVYSGLWAFMRDISPRP